MALCARRPTVRADGLYFRAEYIIRPGFSRRGAPKHATPTRDRRASRPHNDKRNVCTQRHEQAAARTRLPTGHGARESHGESVMRSHSQAGPRAGRTRPRPAERPTSPVRRSAWGCSGGAARAFVFVAGGSPGHRAITERTKKSPGKLAQTARRARAISRILARASRFWDLPGRGRETRRGIQAATKRRGDF